MFEEIFSQHISICMSSLEKELVALFPELGWKMYYEFISGMKSQRKQ